MFFSKNKGAKTTDVVYLTEQGFTTAIGLWMDQHPTGWVVVWFQQDMERLRQALAPKSEESFHLADRLAYSQLSGRPVLFAGHYPLHAAEQELCDSQGLKEMLVYSHLDMPLYKLFGSLKIKELMIKMGMKEDEPITHAMITGAINNAQDKLAKQQITDMHVSSEEEWMNRNGNLL